ncbi:hypothetical protein [Parasynechococcus sp.]|uniref:hypothetical protein n=1 Tax=Parasynechococcus sp. TaxID=3101203 RepID=UPI0037044254
MDIIIGMVIHGAGGKVDAWLPLVDGAAGECCLNQPLSAWAEPWGQGTAGDRTHVLSPLQQLALHQEER